ncbi:MAG: hypothetical protein JSV04_01650 [Candidatus Heimdallarchaeota archaeon]|nr:MAG: hypothetical protein JSV04_01650 [Candidatus Heimdallarchaeota archaeon]
MSKKIRGVILIALLAIAIITTAVIFLLNTEWFQLETGLNFNPGNRYSSTKLDYMDVIYESPTDIYTFREGYSETADCPWKFEHNGIDYFLKNGSKVLSATPGKMKNIYWTEHGEGDENYFHVNFEVRFNASVIVDYCLESTPTPEDRDRQIGLIKVQVGEWVEIRQELAIFLNVLGDGSHIHFMVKMNEKTICPMEYFSPEAYSELIDLIHTYHPDWDLCYP